ncbi:hypothetical protein [Pseudoalteromonas obscura]|uniref:AbiTii domain-containing protein n=1 Tax=Pseudoalteromonas obscura TaxID=3048491 RepID=A0ABT7EK70_9GAMM|nr:hypothetical protein [Pseudoalteromonas sp. P94(2023)]MDK2595430.1 hypothetical protein [Pseudoalteromonas sp. P94(2023)]
MAIFSKKNTSLIAEIQSLAANNRSNLSDLLRKCLIVSKKLKLKGFEEWIYGELEGYPDPASVPTYRMVRCTMHLHNPVNGLIPFSIKDPQLETYFTSVPIVQSLSSLESLRDKHVDGYLTLPLSGEDIALINSLINTHGMPSVRRAGVSNVDSILDAVRNNILKLALDFEEAGIKGENMSFTADEKKQVTELQNVSIENFQGILGPVTNSTVTQNNAIEIKKQDFESLAAYLKTELNVGYGDISTLKAAIDADQNEQKAVKGEFGPKVSEWIGTMVTKAASGAWGVSIATAGGFLANALTKFYGF